MKRIMICTFLLLASNAHAQSLERTATYQAVTANPPVGISRLRVTPVYGGRYSIVLTVIAPNRTQHTGHIQGLATRDGDRFTLSVANFQPDGNLDSPPLCTLVIEVRNSSAKVISENYCAAYHGAGASFFEEGQNLVRVPFEVNYD
jgi:hypothetical protein